jgi:hypothetical protein
MSADQASALALPTRSMHLIDEIENYFVGRPKKAWATSAQMTATIPQRIDSF